MQGVEKLNDFIKTYYFRSNNKMKKKGAKNDFVYQLMKKRNRIEFFNLSNDSKISLEVIFSTKPTLPQPLNIVPIDPVESTQESINIIKSRIEKLVCKLKDGPWVENDADAELEKNAINKEISEMKALLSDLTDTPEDSAELNQDNKECKTNGFVEESNEEVDSLIQSKRKLMDEENICEKKIKLSDVANESIENK